MSFIAVEVGGLYEFSLVAGVVVELFGAFVNKFRGVGIVVGAVHFRSGIFLLGILKLCLVNFFLVLVHDVDVLVR